MTGEFINTSVRKRLGGMRLSYQMIDDEGTTQQAWGLSVDGDLPLDPWALRSAIAQLPWRESPDEAPAVEVMEFEQRSAGAEVVRFIVECTPQAIFDTGITAGLMWMARKLKSWSKPKWPSRPDEPANREEWLALAVREATSLAYEEFRDIPDLTVVAESISHISTDQVSAMIAMRTSAGDTITTHLWFEDGALRHTSVRSRPEG